MLDYNYNLLIPGFLYKTSNDSDLYLDFNTYKLIIDKSDTRLTESMYCELTPIDILMYISHVPEIEYVKYEMFDRGYENPLIPIYLNMKGNVLIPLNNSNRNAKVSVVNDVTPIIITKGYDDT